MISRTHQSSCFFAAMSIALTVGTSAIAADVTVMGYQGAFGDNFTKAFVEPFNAAHPDIKVTFYPVSNAAAVLGNLRAQKGSPQVDIIVNDLSVSKIAADEGLIAAANPANLPNYADIDQVGRQLGPTAIPVTYDTDAMLFNRDAFPTAPTSWGAMWAPEMKGKVVAPAQGGGDVQAILLTIFADRYAGGSDYKNPRAGIEKLVELAPSVQTWEPKPDAYTLVGNGTASIGIGYNARAQYYFDRTDGALRSVIPKEGTVAQINAISLVAGGKQTAAAETFINYALSQARFADLMFYAPTNTKTIVKDETKKRIPFLDPAARASLIDIDWMAIGDLRTKLLDPWKRRIIPASR